MIALHWSGRMETHFLMRWRAVSLRGLSWVISTIERGQWGFTGSLLAVLGIDWALALFNFMDGIDESTHRQAIFMAGAGATFAMFAGLSNTLPAVGLVFAAASLGFLIWNRPPRASSWGI